MKKKLVIAVVLAAVLTTGTAFASPVHPDGLGIGVLWGGNVGIGSGGYFGNSAALSLHVPSVPIFWGIRLGFGDHTWIGVQGDVYIMGSYFVGDMLGWFLGLGLYGNFGFGNNAWVQFGGRLPIGLTFQPIDLLEIFFNLAPNLGFHLYTGGGGSGGMRGGIGVEIGLRLWL